MSAEAITDACRKICLCEPRCIREDFDACVDTLGDENRQAVASGCEGELEDVVACGIDALCAHEEPALACSDRARDFGACAAGD